MSYSVMPLAEADFLAVVGDEGLNDARTPEEAYEHISAYRPFIEMPDLQGEKTDIARLTALDVGAAKAPWARSSSYLARAKRAWRCET